MKNLYVMNVEFYEGVGKTLDVPIMLPPLPNAVDFSEKRILVADDNVEGGLLLRALLSQRGHDVTVVQSGEDALRIAKDLMPHVGLLDIGMPGMSGYTLAEELRRDPAHRELFLVAITGWGQEEDKRRAIDAGFELPALEVRRPSLEDAYLGLVGERAVLAGAGAPS